MAKPQTIYTCSNCDAQTPKWSGRCLECGKWGTIEESVSTESAKKSVTPLPKFNNKSLVNFNEIDQKKVPRIPIGIREVDLVFGGGIVPGSLILLGGEPGIGKSTLMLQVLKALDTGKAPLLYLSGEESGHQVKRRADRLNYTAKNLQFLSEVNVEQIIAALIAIKPQLAIIDSIQTIYSSDIDAEAGSISQIRACTVKLLETAKKYDIPVIITGHVTKEGAVAGPKTLEHLVDVVLYLEGDKYHGFRLLRSTKNRFGATNELAVLEMTATGLKEVKNPSEAFLSQTTQNLSGTVISCFADGNRAFLCEVQALLTPTLFGYPQRKTSGFDTNRLQMLSAVISKRTPFNLQNYDMHVNVVGGFKIKEPAIDLAVCAAMISAKKDTSIDRQTIILGEVGLGGEVRPIRAIEQRLHEAKKLAFTTAIVPSMKTPSITGLKIMKVKHLKDLNLF